MVVDKAAVKIDKLINKIVISTAAAMSNAFEAFSIFSSLVKLYNVII